MRTGAPWAFASAAALAASVSCLVALSAWDGPLGEGSGRVPEIMETARVLGTFGIRVLALSVAGSCAAAISLVRHEPREILAWLTGLANALIVLHALLLLVGVLAE